MAMIKVVRWKFDDIGWSPFAWKPTVVQHSCLVKRHSSGASALNTRGELGLDGAGRPAVLGWLSQVPTCSEPCLRLPSSSLDGRVSARPPWHHRSEEHTSELQ